MASRGMKRVMKLWRVVEPLWNLLARIFSHKAVIVTVSVLAGLLILGLVSIAAYGKPMPVLQTHGLLADRERELIFITVILGIVVVVPVFILLFGVAWRYRASNKKAKYEPEYDGNRGLELLWWGIPGIIILVLGVITVISTIALDPYKSLDSDKKPINVQVISLQWKWLFIYPDYHVASVQQMVIPEDTPINLTLTSDAPMNSFWVPALSGQVYTMNGMSTQLHIMADDQGTYNGTSANISGDGFADMAFKVISKSDVDFTAWAVKHEGDADTLDQASYNELAKPSKNVPVKTYKLTDANLYNEVVAKYMDSGMENM
jgi:cytochrome o ubiquinol oxidase subunit II